MLLYPTVPELLKYVDSRYMLVNVIAKRAREISAEAEENGTHLDINPVTLAVRDIAAGKVTAYMNKGE
ncbi:MAG: DNA-directed RNA polymerase subunit omega [Oscillospiraceae bacterium]|nr:DNA-directed RNA polymerase subunit omega [Oscillospiraceae bacterium]